jgi:hypothetical protein
MTMSVVIPDQECMDFLSDPHLSVLRLENANRKLPEKSSLTARNVPFDRRTTSVFFI